ncbi:MAG: AAA family ATPase, partial [Desulfocapsaceae bacterium]|nr:AAA family ATPase [Desulfocapsaceae bacterium]
MYTDFYQLKQKPFQISSDPSFIWLGEKHKEALATLRYSVIDNKGLMLLTGDVGTGKTTLINTLLKSLGKDVYYASVPDPRLELIDFLNYVGQAFHIDNNFESKGSFLIHFGWFLESVYKQKKKALLIIDEAQLLTQNLLEEIRLLSNINRDGNHLLNIFFVGQNEFNEILHRPENRAVTQRITLNYQIDQLSEEETALYIQHRLRVAGAAQPIFTVSAMKAIFSHSQGIPRRINVICDHCLLTGYTEGNVTIDEKIVEDCVRDIAIPYFKRPPLPETEKPQPPAGAEPSRLFRPRWLRAALLLLSVLLLSSVLALFMSNSKDVSGTLISAYQSVAGYLSPASSSNNTLQKPQSEASPVTTSGPATGPETAIQEPLNTARSATDSADTSSQEPAQHRTLPTPTPPSEDQAAGTTSLKAAGNSPVAESSSGTIGSGADTER